MKCSFGKSKHVPGPPYFATLTKNVNIIPPSSIRNNTTVGGSRTAPNRLLFKTRGVRPVPTQRGRGSPPPGGSLGTPKNRVHKKFTQKKDPKFFSQPGGGVRPHPPTHTSLIQIPSVYQCIPTVGALGPSAQHSIELFPSAPSHALTHVPPGSLVLVLQTN